MDDSSDQEGHTESKIVQAHTFFRKEIGRWAGEVSDPRIRSARIAILSDVLQFRLQVVSIDLEQSDDEQLIFEALNDRGTPLLAADLIKNFIFQSCETVSGDVDQWCDDYWGDFDEDWWRGEVSQGRQFKSRIDLFLHYWLTMRRKEEVPTEKVFDRFKTYAAPFLNTSTAAESFLRVLRGDAQAFRELVTQESDSRSARFYSRVVEDLELGTFIPLLLFMISGAQPIPADQVEQALDAVESMVVRRSLLRMTTKDLNSLVVALLKELDQSDPRTIGAAVTAFLLRQTADARKWPTDDDIISELPFSKLYGNVKQSRLRVVLSAIELHRRKDERVTVVALPEKLEIEHVMPQGWRNYWKLDSDATSDDIQKRDRTIDTIGNLTLVTKKLNKTLSNRPWLDSDAVKHAVKGQFAGLGKKSILEKFSGLQISSDLLDANLTSWDEDDIFIRGLQLTEDVLDVWPRPKAET